MHFRLFTQTKVQLLQFYWSKCPLRNERLKFQIILKSKSIPNNIFMWKSDLWQILLFGLPLETSCAKSCWKKKSNLKDIRSPWTKNPKFDKRRPCIQVRSPWKKNPIITKNVNIVRKDWAAKKVTIFNSIFV